jgi:hypothetical protein
MHETVPLSSLPPLRRLKEQEAKLDEITKKQGSSVDSFVKLVKENRETLEKFKVCYSDS